MGFNILVLRRLVRMLESSAHQHGKGEGYAHLKQQSSRFKVRMTIIALSSEKLSFYSELFIRNMGQKKP
jgi:hypothetical protein